MKQVKILMQANIIYLFFYCGMEYPPFSLIYTVLEMDHIMEVKWVVTAFCTYLEYLAIPKAQKIL